MTKVLVIERPNLEIEEQAWNDDTKEKWGFDPSDIDLLEKGDIKWIGSTALSLEETTEV